MSDPHDKGNFQADIPANAVEEALRSVERVASGEAAAAPEATISVEPGDGPLPDAAAAELESVRLQLELSQAKGRETLERLKDQHDRFLRASADLENYRKRALKEREEVQKFGTEMVLKDLLPAVDGLDRALAAAPGGDPLADGVRLVRATLEKALAKHGMKAFSAMGQPFDPAHHEALLQVPTADQPAGTVVLEHARGWRLHERLVRPAMVGVAVAPPPPDGAPGGEA